MKNRIENTASPDAETETNERGGSQSKIPVRFDLIDAKAIFEMASVLHEGAEKYGEGNWRLIPVEDHLNHLIMHAYAYLAGDRTDDHLSHIMCRATFAQGVAIAEDEEEVDYEVLRVQQPIKSAEFRKNVEDDGNFMDERDQ